MAHVYYIAELDLMMSQAEIYDKMRELKAARESGADFVGCFVSGFDSDPRPLWEIASVRAFCARLVDSGFVSYLDPFASTNPDPNYPSVMKDFLGSFEIYMMANGRKLDAIPMTHELMREFEAALIQANKVSDAAIGK